MGPCIVIIILMYIQRDATLHSLFYLETALHVSGGTITHHEECITNVSTASGICHTVTAICRYRGRVGTGLSVLWVACLRAGSGCSILILFAAVSKPV